MNKYVIIKCFHYAYYKDPLITAYKTIDDLYDDYTNENSEVFAFHDQYKFYICQINQPGKWKVIPELEEFRFKIYCDDELEEYFKYGQIPDESRDYTDTLKRFNKYSKKLKSKLKKYSKYNLPDDDYYAQYNDKVLLDHFPTRKHKHKDCICKHYLNTYDLQHLDLHDDD